ncbi:hypothetical protein TNIN_404291 [Trichonephila inaurata madagascariensis]|uniref:Uncharacterized protein n=1 Tax=Trichonephila inaurata madagascariensis TaxID=2747483 RepID=A0A8X6WTI0_9ARAC|nr:hypothetical protein TNIN_404291 [Trichonephila inaurata madagascariensis]
MFSGSVLPLLELHRKEGWDHLLYKIFQLKNPDWYLEPKRGVIDRIILYRNFRQCRRSEQRDGKAGYNENINDYYKAVWPSTATRKEQKTQDIYIFIPSAKQAVYQHNSSRTT